MLCRPGEIEVLTAAEAPRTIVASGTSPSDDGPTGRAASYDLRLAPCPPDPAAAPATSTAAPHDAGSPERTRIGNLLPGKYCLAVRSTDDAGNVSAFSDITTITLD